MKRALIAIAAAIATGAAFTAAGAPYEDYKMQIQRVQEAKLKGAPQQHATMGFMNERMPLMQEMDRQMQEARSVDQMTAEQMRDWIKRHTGLMDKMHQQMEGRAPMMGMPMTPARPAQ